MDYVKDFDELKLWCRSRHQLGKDTDVGLFRDEFVRIWGMVHGVPTSLPEPDVSHFIFGTVSPHGGGLDIITFHEIARIGGPLLTKVNLMGGDALKFDVAPCTCDGPTMWREPSGCKCGGALRERQAAGVISQGSTATERKMATPAKFGKTIDDSANLASDTLEEWMKKVMRVAKP
jgi:hypothetical protein